MTIDATLYEGPESAEARRERERVAAGELPLGYGEPWARPFFAAARPALRPGVSVLDVGSGRRPTLPPDNRPRGSRYVGLDISADELSAAGSGAYDQIVASDITQREPELEGCFDVVLSWQVLEHVDSMATALENMHAYLRPGGRIVSQISGRFAPFALLARVFPHSISRRLMQRLLGARPEEKFPTRYDRCSASALEPLLAGWSQHGIIPRFKGGVYFSFFRPLERAYLAYENWAERSGRVNLATHYVIWAVR
jgi:SAM-dependent methyltransferase